MDGFPIVPPLVVKDTPKPVGCCAPSAEVRNAKAEAIPIDFLFEMSSMSWSTSDQAHQEHVYVQDPTQYPFHTRLKWQGSRYGG